jgi:SanA protein
LAILLCAAVLSAFTGYVYVHVDAFSQRWIFSGPDSLSPGYTAIVLGARVYDDGSLSNMMEDRMLAGMELYKAGKVKKILISGDHGRKNYDEVNTIRNHLLNHGIPPEDIFMDHAGFDTYDSMFRAREVFGVKDAVIVTQRFHLPRAVYIARKLGLDASGLAADKREYRVRSKRYSFVREIPARVKAFLDVEIFHSSPKFLGEKIPITGDGRKTVD